MKRTPRVGMKREPMIEPALEKPLLGLHTATQGDLSGAEMRLLRQLYPQFQTALCRLGSLEREHSVRKDLEAFLRRLPLPTILLRWNLKPIYQNRAAREFCTVWEKGPEDARRTKATSPIPSEILDRCRLLKFGDGEKAPPRDLPQARSQQPQPAGRADAVNRAAVIYSTGLVR